jgi:hypothetical protein
MASSDWRGVGEVGSDRGSSRRAELGASYGSDCVAIGKQASSD